MMKRSMLLFSVLSIWVLGLSTLPSVTFKNDDNQYKTQESVKDVAFTVLREKCNVCHATKKRTDIFTLQNMDSLAMDIHKQVFIKKKMPKGRKVILTGEEEKNLRLWLDATLTR